MKRVIILAAIMLVVAMNSMASAAIVESAFSGPGGLDLDGTFEYAVNFTTDGSNQTVNGVVFTPYGGTAGVLKFYHRYVSSFYKTF